MTASSSSHSLTATEVIRFVKEHEDRRLTLGMLRFYTERAYIKPRPMVDQPNTVKRRGRPCTVFYSAADLILVRWMIRLADAGVSLIKFEGAMKSVRARLPDALEKPQTLKFFLLDRNREVGVSHDGTAFQLTGSPGQVLLAFPTDIVADTLETLNTPRAELR